MNLQTLRDSTHGCEERGTSFNVRMSANIFFFRLGSEYREGLSAILTFPHDIVEHENARQEVQNKYHKVQIVLHADWSNN
jgi:hypothetical protein